MRKSKWMIIFTCFILMAGGIFTASPPADAAERDSSLSSMDKLFDSLQALEIANKIQNQRTVELRRSNDQSAKSVREAVKQIGAVQIKQLENSWKQAQARYAPLLSQYAALQKQLKEARARKDKKSVTTLSLQINSIKPSVDAARLEIRNRRAALTAAKNTAAAQAKPIQTMLSTITTIRKDIQTEKKHISGYKKSITAGTKVFNQAVKRGDAITALAQLTRSYTLLQQVAASQQKVHVWEQKITGVIQDCRSRLPK
ncbi:hypothetical protein Q5741_17560 [Paenibacillus sp. JX-17]|uniref:Uncharacterized protein n=1 Tax=Paenibacillus lacisoli TaxID=3064525 RepID=A0ABT9CI21_9BACL|nr:hypothetical protein [Paenibacillus sp. JX-17]MDO7908213.1 hypothetical protein [Paenibacillus sp. JX-17]